MADGFHDVGGDALGIGRAIADAEEDEGVGQTSDAKTHAAFTHGLIALCFERIIGDVNGIVEHAHGDFDRSADAVEINAGVGREGVGDKAGEVDGAEQAGAKGGRGCSPQGLVARMSSQ